MMKQLGYVEQYILDTFIFSKSNKILFSLGAFTFAGQHHANNFLQWFQSFLLGL